MTKRYEIRKVFKIEMAHQLDKAYSECCASTIPRALVQGGGFSEC